MPHYCIYKKDKHILLVNRTDESRATMLISQRYDKQFEEVTASDAQAALLRFRDICQEEKTTESAFTTGGAFVALTFGLKAAVDSLLLNKGPEKSPLLMPQ